MLTLLLPKISILSIISVLSQPRSQDLFLIFCTGTGEGSGNKHGTRTLIPFFQLVSNLEVRAGGGCTLCKRVQQIFKFLIRKLGDVLCSAREINFFAHFLPSQ